MDYSIENLIEKIDNKKSKKYFEEVVKTYYIGCYRSSVVMLYSVVICDLVFKLEELRDVYSDSKAEEILENLKRIQGINERSADWENKIVDLVKSKTNLLTLADVEIIDQLKKFRHLSAHPVIGDNSILFMPFKENVKSFLISILNGVLTKPAFYSNNIFETFIKDISRNKMRFEDSMKLRSYLTAKYFSRLNDIAFQNVFKGLWKFVFVLNNAETIENSEINYKALVEVFSFKREMLIKYINEFPSYFKVNYSREDTVNIEKLVYFLVINKAVYNILSEDVAFDVDDFLSQNTEFNLLACFKFESFEDYYVDFEYYITNNKLSFSDNNLKWLKFIFDNNSIDTNIYKMYAKLYLSSDLYDTADRMFYNYIEPNYEYFSVQDLKDILNQSDFNPQVKYRKKYKNSVLSINKCLEDRILVK